MPYEEIIRRLHPFLRKHAIYYKGSSKYLDWKFINHIEIFGRLV